MCLCTGAYANVDIERFNSIAVRSHNAHPECKSMKTDLAMLALDARRPTLGQSELSMRVAQLRSRARFSALTLTELEGLRFPAEAAQFIFDGKPRRAAEEEWGKVVAARRDDSYAWLPGISRAAEGDLRSAAGVVGSRGRAVFCRGRRSRVVGTRHPSPYGTGVAEMLCARSGGCAG